MRLLTYWIAASLVLVATLVILRIVVRRDYLRNGKLTPVSSGLEWLLVIIWVVFSYIYLPADWPLFHINPMLRYAGWLFVVIGVLIIIISFAWLGLRRTHGLETDILIHLGPYRLTRNPQIVGFGLGMIGFIVLWPSWHMMVSIILLIVLTHLMVLTEEEHLLDVHGDEYKRYCGQVPRYVGKPKWKPDAAG